MLPFLKVKRSPGIVTVVHKAEGGELSRIDDQDQDYGIETCAAELIQAINAKDEKRVAEALRDAFEILDSEPHEEGPHISEEEQK